MPQPRVLNFGPSPLSQAAGNFGSGLSQGMLENMERQRLEQELLKQRAYDQSQKKMQEDSLSQLINSVPKEGEQEDVIKSVFGARGVDLDTKKAIYGSISDVRKEVDKKRKEDIQKEENKAMQQKLIQAGLPEGLSDIYSDATTGGKTELIKFLVKRAEWDPQAQDVLGKLINSGQVSPEVQQQVVPNPQVQQPIEQASQLQTPTPAPKPPLRPIEDDSKLPPNKRYERQEARYTKHFEPFNKHIEETKDVKSTTSDINILKDLNESGDLNKGLLQNLNVNPVTGEILLPALATPQQQLYAKVINGFVRKAKAYFPGRVTNFDLDKFMATFPRLNNSPEGREIILRQMDIANKIMLADRESFEDVMQNQYGIRNIDWPDAERLASEQSKDTREKLEKELLSIKKTTNNDDRAFIDHLRKQLKPGEVLLQRPDGQYKKYSQKNADIIMKRKPGYKKL